jgi:hypothetical protein
MAIAGVTNASVVADSTLTESINAAVRFGVQSPFLYQDFVYMPPTLVGTKRWSIPIFANLTRSASYTESDTVTAQALAPTAVDVDCAGFATAVYLSDLATAVSAVPLVPTAVEALMRSYNLGLETDALGLVSSMTNTTGSSATTFDVANFVAVSSAFRAQAKSCSVEPLMVLSESAKRDLQGDVMASGASILSSIGAGLNAALSVQNQGQWVSFNGFRIASTSEVPTVSSGKGNFITQMGPNEFALGLAFCMEGRIVPALLPQAVGMYLVASDAHGVGIADQSRCYRFITKA